ncbi:hypothetical protein BGZ79_009039 [Entomortierella chlamydospora]|nr:hypothetical protein BGZ79_009039 [Entomortierella chlamydospora]
MKIAKSTLLISIMIATNASAVPLTPNLLSRRGDNPIVNAIVKVTAGHCFDIANPRSPELPKEKALLDVAIKAKIDQAKKDCSLEALEPLIKATIEAETDSDDKWADNEETKKKKLLDLNVKIANLILDRIQANVNAELLSKDCTEIAPAEEPLSAESAELEPGATEEPAPEAPTTASEETLATPESCIKGKGGINICLNVDANIDPKFVSKSGCKDAKDAKFVLDLRVNLEKTFEPHLDHFHKQEVPAAYE